MGKLKELCLEVSNQCSMSCLHCSTRSVSIYSPKTEIDLDCAIRLVDQFKLLGGEILEISGGEPLQYKNLCNIINYSKSQGLEVRLYTSGIRKLKSGDLAGITHNDTHDFIEAGLAQIIFNLEGASSSVHETIVQEKGAFELVIDNLIRCKEAGLWVGVHFVPMLPNFQDIYDVFNLCSRLNVDQVSLLRFVPQGRGLDNRNLLEIDTLEFDKLLEMIGRYKSLHPKQNIRVGCPMDFLSLYCIDLKPHPCKAGLSTCVITPEGDVLPCPGFKNYRPFVAGNIYQQSLAGIWNNGFHELRSFNFKNLTGPCKTCSELEWCQGRCMAQRVLAYGDLHVGPDPNCPKNYNKNLNHPNTSSREDPSCDRGDPSACLAR